jgi:hypothetical protein
MVNSVHACPARSAPSHASVPSTTPSPHIGSLIVVPDDDPVVSGSPVLPVVVVPLVVPGSPVVPVVVVPVVVVVPLVVVPGSPVVSGSPVDVPPVAPPLPSLVDVGADVLDGDVDVPAPGCPESDTSTHCNSVTGVATQPKSSSAQRSQYGRAGSRS